MKINDIEKLTGLKRSNIFYYEREGLIAPNREDNNYREYSEDDLRRLKTIVVLRKLGFTVAEIKDLLEGERELADVLPENLARLSDKEAELEEAIKLCREMERQGITMESFDADEWFETIESEETQGKRFLDLMGDMADDATRTMAFMQESVGFYGPVWALYFLSEEGIRKRRLWKWYWVGWAIMWGYLLLAPAGLWGLRLTHPWAAAAWAVLEAAAGSLALLFCARFIIPGRKPRQAFWLTVAVTLGVSFLLVVAGRPALELEPGGDWAEAFPGYIVSTLMRPKEETVEDPLAYVQTEYNGRYYGGKAELDTWEAGDQMFVFTSWGTVFQFQRLGDGRWQDLRGVPTAAGGTLYTADPYGPREYSSRLMLADGTVVEPVYEAHFSTGYIPLYAFDVPAGQTYTGLEYGVDENGGMHYEIDRVDYNGTSAWELPIIEEKPLRSHSLAEVLRTAAGEAFLEAFRGWRAELWAAEPDMNTSGGLLGVEGGFTLWVTYYAPSCLTVNAPDTPGIPADWGLIEFSDCLYLEDDGARLVWQMTCDADVSALLAADEITPTLLLEAARTAQVSENSRVVHDVNWFIGSESIPYAETRKWKTEVPDPLCALGGAVFSELNG